MGSTNATLTAQWTAIKYQIKYEGNGATGVTEGANPMPNSEHTYDVAKNLSKNTYKRQYTVTYNYNNGKPNQEDTTAIAPAIATATFNGWSETATGEKKYDDQQEVTNLSETQGAVVSIYANWTLGSVTPPSPERTGYTFKGWNTKADGTGDNIPSPYTPTGNITLYAKWEPYTATVTFTKRDSITEEVLNGATFGLYEWNGTTYERKSTLTDNGNGTYTTALMTYRDGQGGNQGKFKIKEERAPQYYTNAGYEKEIQLTEPGHHDYTTGNDMTEEPNKIKIKASKIDSETGNKIAGVTFTIYEWNKDTQSYDIYSRNNNRNEQDETMHFQEDRTYLSEWLYANRKNEGKFRIIETGTPDGYYGDFSNGAKKCNDITVTDGQGGNNGTTINLSNSTEGYKNTRVKGTINVNKIDKETQRYLAQGDASLDGAVYGLYAAENIIHKDTVTGKIYDKDQLVESQTVANGQLTYEDIEIGKYYIKEITPPKGYLKDETKYPINMNYEGETVAHLTRNTTVIEQVKKQAFILQKYSSNSSSTERPPLEGAGFKIFLIKDLSKVKDGSLTPSSVKFTYKDFLAYDFNGEQTAIDYKTNPEGTRIPELYTNAQGQIISPELAYGKYVVIESTVPEDREPIEPFIVEIEEDSRTPQSQRFFDDKEFEAQPKIIKKDSKTERNVLNKKAKYRIWNKTKGEYVEQAFTYPTVITYGTEENPYETNEKGEFITPLKLQIGEYELQEIQAPEGYIKTGHEGKLEKGKYTEQPKQAVEFRIKANTAYYEDPDLKQIVINVEQYNEQTLGELEITKTGEQLVGTETKQDGTIKPKYEEKEIEGAEFEIYAKEDIYSQDGHQTKICEKDQKISTITTNEEGKAYQDNLPIGKYYIKETKTTEGYVLNTETKEFEITYQGQETATQKIEIKYKNERQKINPNGKEQLKIEKTANKSIYKPGEQIEYTIKITNTTPYPITDIKIEETMIQGKFEEKQTENIKTTGNKTAEIKKLEPGQTEELKFIVQLNKEQDLEQNLKEKIQTQKETIKNKIEATGTIEKPDPNPPPDDPDKKIKEEIKGQGEEEITVTNKKLVIVKEALKEQYEIGETARYIIKIINNGTEPITKVLIEEHMLEGRYVGIEELNKNGLEIANEGQKIAINKIDPGETITLIYESEITENTQITIDENHKMQLGNKITIKGKIEPQNPTPPPGQDPPEPEEIEDEATEQIEITEQDTTQLGIIKKDNETKEAIEGATIGLYAKEDITDRQGNIIIAKDTLIEKAQTNGAGQAKYETDLPLGKYYIKEIEAPAGYKLSQETIEIDGTYKGENIQEITISKILGNQSTKIKIAKTDIEGNLIKGAKLELQDEKGNTIHKWETKQEIEEIRKLEPGKTYTLKETKPANGYVTAKEIKFTIDNQEKIYTIQQETQEGTTLRDLKTVDYIQMVDEKTKITIETIDKETGKPIPGIKVEIKDKETGEIIYEYETDENPKEIIGLPIGNYEIKTTDPENRGYITETKEIEVKDTSKEQKQKIEKDYTKIEINLKDEETKETIKEGTFEIKDKNGKTIQTIETKEGKINLEKLPIGEYTIHQKEAPKGYHLAQDIKIKISDTGELQKFEIYNKKKIINYGIEKTLKNININGQDIPITNSKLVKQEIKTSEIKTTQLVATYNIKVTNQGEIEGKVKVTDTIPEGLKIVEAPSYWTEKAKGQLEAEIELQAGESKDLYLILKWENGEKNLGNKTNKASLETDQEDINAKDDLSEATIILTIKTGLETNLIIIGSLIIIISISSYAIITIKRRINTRVK